MNSYQLLLLPNENSLRLGVFGKKYRLHFFDQFPNLDPFPNRHYGIPNYIYHYLNNPTLLNNHDYYIFEIMVKFPVTYNISRLFKPIPSFIIKHFKHQNYDFISNSNFVRLKPFSYTYYQNEYHFINENAWFTYNERTEKIKKQNLGFSSVLELSACVENNLIAVNTGKSIHLIRDQNNYSFYCPNAVGLSVKPYHNSGINISYHQQTGDRQFFVPLRYTSLFFKQNNILVMRSLDNIAHYQHIWNIKGTIKKTMMFYNKFDEFTINIESFFLQRNRLFLQGCLFYSNVFSNVYIVLNLKEPPKSTNQIDNLVNKLFEYLDVSNNMFSQAPYYHYKEL